jgi:hypothetical protein
MDRVAERCAQEGWDFASTFFQMKGLPSVAEFLRDEARNSDAAA